MAKNQIIALDLGASKTAIGIVAPPTKILYYYQIPTPHQQGSKFFIKKIKELIQPLIGKQTKAIALGAAGLVNFQTQEINLIPNFPQSCQKLPLKKTLTNEFKLPVVIDNDVNCFTLAEALYGAGKKHSFVLGLTLGTGIGGGLVINKKLYRGHNNLANEFGHLIIDCYSGPLKTKRKSTYWEDLATGRGLEKIYQKLTNKKTNFWQIIELAKKRQGTALQAVKILADYLGIGLANLINCLAPDIVIIGGGLTNFKPLWLLLCRATRQYIFQPPLKKNVKIVPPKLGDQAILIGAATLVNQPSKFEL